MKVTAWQVNLGGSLRGTLNSYLSTGSASVQAAFSLATGNTGGFLIAAPTVPGSNLTFSPNNRFTVDGDVGELAVNSSSSSSVLVSPGVYTVMGLLDVNAGYTQTFGTGLVSSLFSIGLPAPRDTTQGLHVVADAVPFFGGVGGGGPLPQPIPEPSTLTLLGTGALALAGCSWRRRKRIA
ncbi:MAG TPA: PEP-CTERM sorting domain-containing protein [Pirellulales bacterium]|nr:PEP-CTERM sorting domain-containing protein [Pirellulales bacterium]